VITLGKLVKRSLDFTLSAMALLVLSPLLVLISCLVRWQLGSPVLFHQQRPGLCGRPFTLVKFRTMTDAYGDGGELLPDAQRLTTFGRFLRDSSLDELPELINVLRGELSLVGPRPLLMRYLDRYTPDQMRRHDVRPGLTGWVQVNGRNSLSWAEKLELDLWYVDHASFWLDAKIIALTVLKILKRDGINEPGEATASEFMGTQSDPTEPTDELVR
jgi:sugar transferase EpsL